MKKKRKASTERARYVDAFVIPVPKRKLGIYKKMATLACKVWIEHGALEYRECVGENLVIPEMGGNPFGKMTKLKSGETVIFAWISYKSRAHRDRVNEAVFKDPRMQKAMTPENMPLDPKRVAYGGFDVFVRD